MHHGIFYLALILYWALFYRHVIARPYSLCASEALTYDFPNMVHSGRYWRKGKLPEDPYHWKDYLGVVIGQLYPINIFCSWLSSFMSLDKAWLLYTANLLLHNLAMSIVAYHMFQGGLIGLFGALMWTYAGFHIKQSTFYIHSFFWITATLAAPNLWLKGFCFGMLYLSGHPRFFIYFTYLTIIWYWKAVLIGGVIASYQFYRYYKYSKKSVTTGRTYESKTRVGKVPYWWYLTMFLPIRYEGYVGGVGYQEVNYYITPFALFALLAVPTNLPLTGVVILCIILSHGGMVFRIMSKLMMRFPQWWGHFAMLGVILLTVLGISSMNIEQENLLLLILLNGILLLKNSTVLPLYPFGQWAKKPSEFFQTPMLKYLKGKKVNNLPYPVYRGYLNEIYTVGYTGGNHLKELAEKLNLPEDGIGQYNWFDYRRDGKLLDKEGIEYHYGERPRSPKWFPTPFENLWLNSHAEKDSTSSTRT